ncbi:alpha/beta hydrolase family protein [Isoptericola dokdonensis]|uniref:alpha/beta hydrolase family protein n=1 Tax=Isoptericola dokdonensis TaxID=372663 RepID=UPI00082A9E64|nr:dienelactone hydrolase [Isoptericola dokdonensis]
MVLRTFATSVALLVGLAVVGSVAGPQWDPRPVSDHLVPATADTTVQVSADGRAVPDVGAVGDHAVRTTRVTIALDGATVDGVLRRPLDSDGDVLADRPGVVFVHGAGTGSSAEAFVDTADLLASAGVVTLVPDKRLDTYSTRERDYEHMALDYQRSVDLLRTVEGVDPGRVGVYGESEGTWIAPVMQVDDPAIAFTVLVSAPIVPPREQAAYAVDSYLRNTQVPDQLFRAIPRAVGMQFPGGGFGYADFDVRPWLERQSAPVLVVYGTADPSMPVEQGARIVLSDTAVSPEPAPVTVRYYGGANHGIRLAPADHPGNDPEHPSPLHPDFPRDLAAWVQGLPATGTAEPTVAGATPDQLYLAAPVPRPGWWGNGDVVVVAVVGGAALVLGGLTLLGAVSGWRALGRRRDRPAPAPAAPGIAAPLGVLGLASVATTVVLAVYLMLVARLALDYEKNALVVQGGWVTVRVLGLVAVVAGSVLLLRAARVRAERRAGRDSAVARGGVAHVGVWAVGLGSASLLVTLAYWGVFQLGI